MADNTDLRNQLIQELYDAVNKKKSQIKEYEETVNNEMFLKSTVQGGALAGMARSACDKRADTARRNADALRKSMEWQEEILKKYHF